MVAKRQHSRLNALELKDLIYEKIGHQRADKYFNYLRQLFSSKISKNEFDKFCIRIIGREHVSLHNQLILSVIKNACLAEVPPTKVRKVEGSLNVKVTSNQNNCLQTLYSDGLTSSPRKGRSPVNRHRKFRDRPSPLGPHGKTHNVPCEEMATRVQEQQSATELHSLGSRPPIEVASVEEGEEVEQMAGSPGVQSRSPVTAPFGISMNVGYARNFRPRTCQNSGELPDTRSLRSRLEQKLEAEGLSISADCVNLLNNGLDVFLKRLMEPCIGLARSRCGVEHRRHGQNVHHMNTVLPGRYMERPIQSSSASILDFRVSVESSPSILGADQGIQLEKICSRAYDE